MRFRGKLLFRKVIPQLLCKLFRAFSAKRLILTIVPGRLLHRGDHHLDPVQQFLCNKWFLERVWDDKSDKLPELKISNYFSAIAPHLSSFFLFIGSKSEDANIFDPLPICHKKLNSEYSRSQKNLRIACQFSPI